MSSKCFSCFEFMNKKIGGRFDTYGKLVARHPWKIIFVGILVNCLLGIGLISVNYVTDVKTVYTPLNSRSVKDSEKIKELFPDVSGSNFNGYQMPDLGRQAVVIVKPVSGNILNTAFLSDLKILYESLLDISATDENNTPIKLSDICARKSGSCSVDGDIFTDDEFINAVGANNVPFPYFPHPTRGPIYYQQMIGGANVTSNNLQTASMLLLRINLRTDSDNFINLAKHWEKAFLTMIQNYTSSRFEIAYSHTDSLSEELNENVSGDITFISITFTLMITYACVATMTAKCDCVGQRSNLGYAGVLAAGLSILSSFGFVSGCGVDFVSIVGVAPFLILGIGVDDMFLLMSGITSTNYEDTVEKRIGQTMRTSGVSITITSLTNALAFAAGASSIFLSVRNFCIYCCVAVIFCYINQATIFIASLAINERRTEDSRHYMTCRKVKTAKENTSDSRAACFICCCSGEKPKSQRDSESYLDRIPRWIVPKLVTPKPMKAILLLCFAGYLGISVWGISQLKQGLELQNLVTKSSYHYTYIEWLDTYFPGQTLVSFVFDQDLEYSKTETQSQIQNLISKVKSESTVQSDFEINILDSYKTSRYYDNSSESAYVTNMQTFLMDVQNVRFQNDLVIDTVRNRISQLRVYLISTNVVDSQAQGNFMLRMRELSYESQLSVFAFAPAFVFYEQYVSILPQTLQTVGIALVMVFVVTCIFMPHPILLVFITLTVAMITTGIFGFLHFLGLTLSSITMIHLIMSIGFSIDFAAHICHGYMTSMGKTREEKIISGICHSGAPIFHGAVSSILGVLALGLARSYIFYSFFLVMSIVILFGILHALLFLPVVLSLIGPLPSEENGVSFELNPMLSVNASESNGTTNPRVNV